MRRQGARALLLLIVIGLIVGLSGCATCGERIDKLETTIQGLKAENARLESELELCNGSDTVYVTKHGEKYHVLGCRYLAGKECVIPISRKLAEKCGYTPCSRCKP